MSLLAQIEGHAGTAYFRALKSYSRSKDILSGNAFELKRFIVVLESFEIEDKLEDPGFRKSVEETDGILVRLVHNFAASVATLVEHTRVLMRSRIISSPHRARYQTQIDSRFAQAPLAKF